MILASTNWSVSFFITSILLGVALAIDAFSVTVAATFDDPKMKKRKGIIMALTFALFQFAMPLLGWVLVHYLYQSFTVIHHIIPWVALALLAFLGIKMILSYRAKLHTCDCAPEDKKPSKYPFVVTLLIQGVATSIDALSVGLNTAEYGFIQALVCSLIIMVMTFVICLIGVFVGKSVGCKIGSKAELVGGIILIVIGVFICVKGEISLYVPAQYIPEWLKFIL